LLDIQLYDKAAAMLVWKIKNGISNFFDRVIKLDRIITKQSNRYILAYHRILPIEKVQNEYVQSTMWMSPQTFETQLKWMLQIGDIVNIERILDFETVSKKPLFSLTFDDGWKDNYEYAFPILKRYGITAMIFIVTSAVETGQLLWPEEVLKKTDMALKKYGDHEIKEFLKSTLGKSKQFRYHGDIYEIIDGFLEYLKELTLSERERCIYNYYNQIRVDPTPIRGALLSWDEIIEMDKYGIQFGSHTHTHAILQYCNENTTLNELIISKNILEAKLKKSIFTFCYPNARYKETDSHFLNKVGYKYAFRLHNLPLIKKSSQYFIPRMLMSEKYCKNPNYFKFRLLSIPKY
jgi:peptidoglycan/xylan/chitin deacetylase (PgdA/CDA1 family)